VPGLPHNNSEEGGTMPPRRVSSESVLNPPSYFRDDRRALLGWHDRTISLNLHGVLCHRGSYPRRDQVLLLLSIRASDFPPL